MITGAQCRMARAALRIGVREVAARAGVNPGTVARLETGRGGSLAASVEAIQRALEAAGVEFIENGVKLQEASARPAQ
jgi:transcriptional regulator with XRE-family HTH domain